MLPEPEPWPTPGRVLLVEDDVLLRFLLAEKLREAGLGVIEAPNADEAFSYIQTAAQIDLLFTDVQMPGSIDGVGLARRIGTGYPSVRIILTSGNHRTIRPMIPVRFFPSPTILITRYRLYSKPWALKRPSSP